MNRQHLLIAACVAASVSVGLNVWFLMRKREASHPPPSHPPPADTALSNPVGAPVLPSAEFDFSDTAFADGSWKLTDDPDPAFDLDKPFDWNDLPAQGAGPAVTLTDQEREKMKNQLEQIQAEWRKTKRPVPDELESIPDDSDPNDARSRALLVPAPR